MTENGQFVIDYSYGDARLRDISREPPPPPPQPRLHPSTGQRMTLGERFLRFHLANPHVLDLIVKISRDLKGLGFQRAGMKLVFERIRWLSALETKGDGFRVNNSYTAFYARKVMEEEPDLRGFFRLRESEADAEV